MYRPFFVVIKRDWSGLSGCGLWGAADRCFAVYYKERAGFEAGLSAIG